MTPFLQFRVWSRRGPIGERVLAGMAAALFLVLVAWVAVPVESDDASVSTEAGPSPTAAGPASDEAAPGATPTDTAPGQTGASAGDTSTAGSVTVGRGSTAAAAPTGGGAVTSAAADPCAGLRANDQGVSASEIFVAVPFISLAGEAGNTTFGLRSPADIAKTAAAVAAGINSEGGVACRKLRIKTYEVNPLDPVEQESKCREIIGDKPFSIVDNGGFITPISRQCFLDAKIPYQGAVAVSEEQVGQAYPYLYSSRASVDRAARNWVIEAPDRRWFDPQNRFTKLGILFDGCYPKVNDELIRNLHKVGLRDEQLSVFRMSGCANLNPPSETSAAVVQHRNAGVSHVFLAGNGSNSQQYVRQADVIGWKPAYLTSDFEEETNPTLAAMWPDGFDGAVAITSTRAGERNAGMVSPSVTHCNDWLRKGNVAPSEKEEDQGPMALCDQLRLFAGAANGAGPNLVRTTLVEGLAKVGRFDGASNGLSVFDRPRKVTGGDFIRAIQWHKDCKCWKVVDRDLKPGH